MEDEKVAGTPNNKAKKRKVDIIDLLPQEAVDAFNRLGYDFLSECGYPEAKTAKDNDEDRKALARRLAADGKVLTYHGAVEQNTHAILVWYEFSDKGSKDKTCIRRSTGIKFVPTTEEKAGETTEGG